MPNNRYWGPRRDAKEKAAFSSNSKLSRDHSGIVINARVHSEAELFAAVWVNSRHASLGRPPHARVVMAYAAAADTEALFGFDLIRTEATFFSRKPGFGNGHGFRSKTLEDLQLCIATMQRRPHGLPNVAVPFIEYSSKPWNFPRYGFAPTRKVTP